MTSSSSLDWSQHAVFVTGGTGFVGSHLVNGLLAAGCQDVRCLVRKDAKWLDGLPVTLIEGTLSDAHALQEGLRGAHYVFHSAALTRSRHWKDFLEANVHGTENLLKASALEPAIKRIVLLSSLAAIGDSGQAIADETAALAPVSMYGRSKAEMEQMAATYDLPVTILRPSAVYGPRETDIFTFFKTVSTGFCPIVGSASAPALSLVHVGDLVQGILGAALHPEAERRTFFLGGMQQYSWGEIRDATAKALNRKVLTVTIPKRVVPFLGSVLERVGSLFNFYPPLNREKASEIVRATLMCDSALARETFGYAPSVELDRGIQETIAWYRNHKWL